MRQMILKLLSMAAVFGLVAFGASANPAPITINLSGIGTVTGTAAGAVNVTLGGTNSITLDFQSDNPCSFSADVTGVTFTSADVSGSISSFTVTQTAAQVVAGVASISGSGMATTVLGVTVNVPITLSGTINVGAGVDICNLTSPITGTVSPTPEPASLFLLGSGLLAMGMAIRRRLAF